MIHLCAQSPRVFLGRRRQAKFAKDLEICKAVGAWSQRYGQAAEAKSGGGSRLRRSLPMASSAIRESVERAHHIKVLRLYGKHIVNSQHIVSWNLSKLYSVTWGSLGPWKCCMQDAVSMAMSMAGCSNERHRHILQCRVVCVNWGMRR